MSAISRMPPAVAAVGRHVLDALALVVDLAAVLERLQVLSPVLR